MWCQTPTKVGALAKRAQSREYARINQRFLRGRTDYAVVPIVICEVDLTRGNVQEALAQRNICIAVPSPNAMVPLGRAPIHHNNAIRT